MELQCIQENVICVFGQIQQNGCCKEVHPKGVRGQEISRKFVSFRE